MVRKSTQKRKLEATVARIHARFGPRSLTRGSLPVILGAPPTGRQVAVPHIPTGFSDLDDALRIGGLPKGKISELVGLPTSGKTTLALKFLVQAQAGGAQVAYIDQARFFDADYAHRCGIDLSRLLVGAPYGLTEALATTEALVHSGSLAALVFDVMDGLWGDPTSSPNLPLVLVDCRLLWLAQVSCSSFCIRLSRYNPRPWPTMPPCACKSPAKAGCNDTATFAATRRR